MLQLDDAEQPLGVCLYEAGWHQGVIGILASRDPVALDRAVLDLVRERSGSTLEALSYPDRDGTVQIDYAAEMGLGAARAEVVEIGA